MKLLSWGKDGGQESTVWGLFFEIKWLFSIVLLRFENGTRDAYHNHAFSCVSWVLKGKLIENHLGSPLPDVHTPSLRPVITRRYTFHKVESVGRTWVISFRGPWAKRWTEYDPKTNKFVTLTHGRKIVDAMK